MAKKKQCTQLTDEQVTRILASLREMESIFRSIPYMSTVKSRCSYIEECREQIKHIRREISGEEAE